MFTPIKNGFKRADKLKNKFTQENIDIAINYDLKPEIAQEIKTLCKQQLGGENNDGDHFDVFA